ncbi:MAG: DEAD/DEAH box helicase [Candidatus Micrarchaeota archaeon]|nr:DEAD/DEAH box helicase [Candidatus Micrarchaeota archaeon]
MEEGPYSLFLNRFGSFTDIQKRAMELVEVGRHCLIMAPTGSGKTEAAVLPVLKNMKERGWKGIAVIYITPLRALNRDLISRLEWICSASGITVGVRHGDTEQKERRMQAERPPQILITTPETLQNLFLSQRLRSSLPNVKAVIVDEVHELYPNKRGAQLSIALERVRELSGNFQRIGISATVGNVAEVGRFLFAAEHYSIAKSANVKKISVNIEMPDKPLMNDPEFAKVFSLDRPALARLERMAELISGAEETLVFGNTRQVVESLGSKLLYYEKLHPFGSIGVHHSSIDRHERVLVEKQFKEKRIKSLIATSSLELGIDIGSINLVIQYGSPRQAARLIQRVGRGGHTEKGESNGTIIVSNSLDCLESVAVAEAMHSGKLESGRMEENAVDVLVNQICAMALEYRKIDVAKAYSIVRRAAPYSGLGRELFDKAVALASDLRLIKVAGKEIGLGARSRDYFFSNISLIPDTKKFIVKILESNRIISVLDEEFVYNYIEEGASFITKGVAWKVVSVENNTIFVEYSTDISAAVPDWEGEDLPVPNAISKAVFDIFDKGLSGHEGIVESHALAEAKRLVSGQEGFFRISNSSVFVEDLDDYIIIYAALGTLANGLMAKIIGTIASWESGSKINCKATPYAIIMDCSMAARRPDMKRLFARLSGIKPDEYVSFVVGTDLFRYKFVQTAKAIGIVSKDSDVTRSTATRIVNFYKDSIVFDDVLRDVKKNYVDEAAVARFIRELGEGAIAVEYAKRAGSPLSQELLRSVYWNAEFLSQGYGKDDAINRLLEESRGKKILMLCTFCGLSFHNEIGDYPEKRILCGFCRSPMVVRYKDPYNEAVQKKLKDKVLSAGEKRAYADAVRESGLISSYGDRALIALSTYGIGLETAARVLKFVRKDYKMFFIDILEAQKSFVKNRKYWK